MEHNPTDGTRISNIMMAVSLSMAIISKFTLAEWVSALSIIALVTTIIYNLMGWVERGSKIYKNWKLKKRK